MHDAITVQRLIEAFEPHMTIAGGATGTERVVESVSATDLADPTPWMAPRSVLLTTGMLIREHPEMGARLIARLDETGMTAIVLAMAPFWVEVPRTMTAAADTLSVPLIRLAGGVAFHTIQRWIFNSLSSQQLYSLQRLVRLQEKLTALLAQGHAVEDILQGLSDYLNADVLLFDWRGNVTARSGTANLASRCASADLWRLYKDSRAASPPVSTLRREDVDIHIQEVRLQGGLERVLVAVQAADAVNMTLSSRTISFAKTLFEIERLAQHSAENLLSQARTTLLEEMLHHPGRSAELTERLAHHGIMDTEPWRLIVLSVGSLQPGLIGPPSRSLELLQDKGMTQLSSYLESLGVPFLKMCQADSVVVLIGTKSIAVSIGAEQFARGLVQQLSISLGLQDLRAGLSESMKGVSKTVEALTHARQALMTTDVNAAPSVVPYEDLGLHFAALNALPNEHLASLRERFVEPLMELDRTENAHLYETLVAFLSHRRSFTATARHLYVHRNTLMRRLLRIDHSLGIDLHSTDDLMLLRMAMHAAEILRLRESMASPLQEDVVQAPGSRSQPNSIEVH
jgi:purine catabolism regulator